KREMAWPGAGLDAGEGWVVRRERAFRGVQAIDEKFVQAKIRRDGESISEIHVNRVRMRPLLPLRIHAGALMLDERPRFAQLPIRGERDGFDAASAIIRHEHHLSEAVH